MPRTRKNELFDKKNKAALSVASNLLRLLSNEQRLALLCHIGEKEASVGDLAETLNLSQSALSQHLARLKDADIVTTRRDHNKVYYQLASKEAATIIRSLKKLYCSA